MEQERLRVDLFEDAWLAAIVGRPVFRVQLTPRGAATLGELPDPVFAYAKVPVDDVAAVDALAREGFRLVDTALTLERPAAPCDAPPEGIRPARADDEAAVAAIAAVAFRFNRFRVDPRFPDALAGRIKESWARSFFAGRRGTHMLIAERNRRAVGFSLLIVEPGRAAIDLIAVAPGHQGRGVGTDLIRFAVAEVTGVRPLFAVTQLANMPSLRLFARLGFRPSSADHILHLTRGTAWPQG